MVVENHQNGHNSFHFDSSGHRRSQFVNDASMVMLVDGGDVISSSSGQVVNLQQPEPSLAGHPMIQNNHNTTIARGEHAWKSILEIMDDNHYAFQYCATNTSNTTKKQNYQTIRSFNQIHLHCSTCIRPNKCIRMPVSFNQTQLSMEEKYSIILDINYYNNQDQEILENGNIESKRKENYRTTDTNVEFCPVVRCTNANCKMVMHYCKLEEHFLLCKYQTVPCINSHYGCPYFILRGQISNHLISQCPANVVHCSAEWNRWPMYTSEKSQQTQVFCSPHSLNINNLDVALALRDQRMLKQLWSASRQMKRIMRGCLSTHPAVPIKPYIGIRTFREFRQNANQTNQADQSNGQSLSANCDNIDEEKYINYAARLVQIAYRESLEEILRQTANYFRRIYYQLSNDYRQPRKKSNSICQMSSMPNSNLTLISNNISLPLSPGQSFPSSSSINLPILTDMDKFFMAKIAGKNNKYQEKCTNEGQQLMVPPPPPVPKCNTLSLEIGIRSIAFFKPKPRAMYTFRCGMDFRKDELAAHSKDIHSDIHGGLNGWIEHRCPLFQYGCTFVHRRLSPLSAFDLTQSSQSTIVYNELLETFACCSSFYENLKQTADLASNSQMPSTGRPSSLISFESDDLDVENTGKDDKIRHPKFLPTNNNSFLETGGSNIETLSFCSSYSLLSNNSSLPLLMSETETSNNSNTSVTTNASISSSRKSSHSSSSANPLIISLNDIPFEILENICKYLDGFSMNNLSFTSKRMRTVVQSFVKKKGYVVLQWKRFEMEKGKYKWRVVYKKWLFSTAMKPIRDWRLDCNNVIAQHLQICPFNERIVQTEPYRIAELPSNISLK